MNAPFDSLVPDARLFLSDLKQNNNRDWFLAHKTEYDARLKALRLSRLDAPKDLGIK